MLTAPITAPASTWWQLAQPPPEAPPPLAMIGSTARYANLPD